MKILFLGTPEFAVPSLEKLIAWKSCRVVGVVTQPDRPAGRGHNLFAPPTKIVANRYAIPVLQPEKLSRSPDVVQQMSELKPDLLVTVAFGQILKKNVLEMAPCGVINVHGSLLPKYRGAAPINWAIINGEKTTGVTTMYSDAGIDTGDMLLSRPIAISDDMTAQELAEVMSFVGADLLLETLEQLAAGSLKSRKQDNEEASAAPRLTKELGRIDWHKSAQEIHNLVRGLVPWPGTETVYGAAPLKVLKTKVAAAGTGTAAGTITGLGDDFQVACGADGSQRLQILEVKPANKGKMSAKDWANGARVRAGSTFDS